MKIGVIINPKSGQGKALALWSTFKKLCMAHEIFAIEGITQYHHHAIELAQYMLKQPIKAILAIGGDGTANQCLNAIKRSSFKDCPLLLVNAGCGGDWLKNFSASKPEAMIQRLINQDYTRVDIGRIELQGQNLHYFFNIASLGMSATIASASNRYPWLKLLGAKAHYLVHSLIGILRYKERPVSIRLDMNDQSTHQLSLLAVCNGRYFGGNMDVAPMACVDDGFFELILFSNFSKLEKMINFPKIYRGQHLQHAKVQAMRARSVEVRGLDTNETLVECDGEVVGSLPIRIVVEPCSTPIIV